MAVQLAPLQRHIRTGQGNTYSLFLLPTTDRILAVGKPFHDLDTGPDNIADFFFADNTTTPVPDVETAFASESYLLQYMFRKAFPTNPDAPYATPLSEWPLVGENGAIANITLGGYEFGPMARDIQQRCEYIDALVMDPLNGV